MFTLLRIGYALFSYNVLLKHFVSRTEQKLEYLTHTPKA